MHAYSTTEQEPILEMAQHRSAVAIPTLWALLMARVTLESEGSTLEGIFATMTGLLALWAFYQLLARRRRKWIVTSEVFRWEYGLFGRRVREVPIPAICSVQKEQSWLGNLLGYGHLRVELADGEEDLHFSHVGRPDLLRRAIAYAQEDLRLRGRASVAPAFRKLLSKAEDPERREYASLIVRAYRLLEEGEVTEEEVAAFREQVGGALTPGPSPAGRGEFGRGGD